MIFEHIANDRSAKKSKFKVRYDGTIVSCNYFGRKLHAEMKSYCILEAIRFKFLILELFTSVLPASENEELPTIDLESL